MYAIVSHGGHQYRVTPGERLLVDRLDAEVGATVQLAPVLFVGGEGSKAADDTVVSATVVSHHKGPKIRVFTYKPKKRRRRTLGHRSHLTELEVTAVGSGKTARAAKQEGAGDGA